MNSGRCLRLAVVTSKRLAKKQVVRRTKRFVEQHVVRSSLVSFVPSVVNEAVVHHKAVTLATILQVASDDAAVTILTALAIALSRV